MTATALIVPGSFFGGELEPFVEPGTWHQSYIPPEILTDEELTGLSPIPPFPPLPIPAAP